jgi:hypothetical protein
MSLQIRRGLDANRTFVADEGEPLWVTDTDRLFVGDGATTGGKAVKALPVGTAGGDLSGSFPDPGVAKVQGNAVESGTPTDGDALIYESANTRWAHKPAGIAGVAVESGTPSNNESLVYESGPARWAHKHPVLTSVESFITADVGFAATGAWEDATSVSLTAGTWLVTATLTTSATMDYNAGSLRLFDGTTNLATAAFYGIIDYAVSGHVSKVVTLTATTTIKLQGYAQDGGMSMVRRAFPGAINATGIAAVRIA